MKKVTIDLVLSELHRLYPDAGCTLRWRTPLELLVATILSAQCTDALVNRVIPGLFRKYHRPEDYLSVPVRVLERDIRSCGTFRVKARSIRESCRMVHGRFGGRVPRTMEELLLLRGVGRKTAAVVLSTAFGIHEGIAVDTHVHRVSRRLQLTRKNTQNAIETDLMRKTSREDWGHISHLLIALGRDVCVARKPRCPECVFKFVCPSSTVSSKQ
ncbi:MAG: endonuclease III [Candidatus Peribacteraceae bacterium]